MEVLVKGHKYRLEHQSPHGGALKSTVVQFQNKEEGMHEEGVTTQEVMRMLIDRTMYCHNCLPHDVNRKIIWHMRMIIALHEARALEQLVAKEYFDIEHLRLGPEGHLDFYALSLDPARDPLAETEMKPVVFPPEIPCDHRSKDNG